MCFANAAGGTIVVGVDDDVPGPPALVGTELEASEVRARIWAFTDPHLTILCEELERDGRRLLLVHVPEGPDVFADTQGRVTQRVEADCVPLGSADIERLRHERRGYDPLVQPSARSRDDVDADALQTARDLVARLGDLRSEMAQRGDDDLLRDLRLVDGRGRLTVAGEVLLCRPERPWAVYVYRPTPGGEVVAEHRELLPGLLAFTTVMALVRAREAFEPLVLPEGTQLELRAFPDLAVREALVNALVHRDLRAPEPVLLEHSPSVLTVTSPGPLVTGVTVENLLTHPSKPRNALLTGAMRALGLAEERGRGIDRMYRELLRLGKEPSDFTVGPESVRVALVGGAPDRRVARFVASLPEVEQDDVDAMLVIFALLGVPRVSAPQLAPAMHRSDLEAEAILRRLADDAIGLVAPTRRTARSEHPNYELRAEALRALGSAVRYHRTSGDEVEGKIVDLLRSEGTVSNRMLQIALDLDVGLVAARLRELVDRGVLVKRGTQKRGPGIRPGAGEAFPSSPPRALKRP